MIAGTGLIERRHRPRAELYATVPLDVVDGAPVLPEVVLWALSLAKGDLLLARRSDVSRSFGFQSYLYNLEIVLDAMCQPWPSIEPMLLQPMAAIGPKGRLRLPDEAAALAAPPAGVLVLRASGKDADLFELEVKSKTPDRPFLRVRKEYTLPIVSGDRVILPADVLWLLGLPEGGRLACKTALHQADFEPASEVESLGDRTWIDLEPDGTLPLPASLRRILAEVSIPYDTARMTLEPPFFWLQLWPGESGPARALPQGRATLPEPHPEIRYTL